MEDFYYDIDWDFWDDIFYDLYDLLEEDIDDNDVRCSFDLYESVD